MKNIIFADIQAKVSNIETVDSVIGEIINYTNCEDIDNIFILGDIFENKNNIDISVFNKVYESLYELKQNCEKMYLLVGNHDYATKGNEHSLKTFFPFCEVISESTYVIGDNYSYYFIPFMKDKKQVLEGFKKCKNKAKEDNNFKIMFFHYDYNGLQVNNHIMENSIDKKDMFLNHYDLVFGGHIHKGQKIADNSCYVGSLFQQNFSECGEEKGFYIQENKEITFIRTHYPEFIRIKTKEDLKKYKKKDFIGSNVEYHLDSDKAYEQIKGLASTVRRIPKSVKKEIESNTDNFLNIDNLIIEEIKNKTNNEEMIDLMIKMYHDKYKSSSSNRNNVVISKLKVNNFQSFDNFEIDFTKIYSDELIGIFGLNKDSKSKKGSNGAGKSTILEALFFGLYGESLRGSKIDAICKRRKKNCFVEIDFYINGKKFNVKRYRKHDEWGNNLVLTDEKGNQNKGDNNLVQGIIDKLITNYNTFKFVSTLSMFGKTFSDSKPSERRDLIERIIGIEWIEEKYKEINNEYLTFNKFSNEKDFPGRIKDILQSKIEDFNIVINNLKDKLEKEKKIKKADNTKIDEEIADIESKIEEKNKIIDSNCFDIDNIEYRLNEAKKEYEGVRAKYQDEVDKVYKETAINGRILSEKKTENKNLKNKLKTKDVDKKIICENCLNEYYPKNFNSKIKEMIDNNNKIIEEYTQICDKLELKKNNLTNKINKETEEKINKINEIRKELYAKDKENTNIKNEINIFESKISELRRKRVDKGNIDFIIKEIDDYENKITINKNKLKQVEGELKDYYDGLNILSMWKEIYSKDGFRRKLFDSLIPLFEDKVNYYLSSFGLKAKMEKYGKKEDLLIYIIDEKLKVEYASYSSGEKNRIDFSLLLALNEIASMLSIKINLLFTDELLSNTDNDGYDILFNTSKEFIEKNNILFFIISHSKDINSLLNKYLLIEKENNNSKIVEVNV